METGNWRAVKLRVASCELEGASWKLRVGSWELEAGSWKLRVASCELRVEDASCKLGVANEKKNEKGT